MIPHIKSQSLGAIKPKITAQQAIDFLSNNPRVLLEHPTLFGELILPFSHNPASFVERQIAKLREHNKEIQDSLTQALTTQEQESKSAELSLELLDILLSPSSRLDMLAQIRRTLNLFLPYDQMHLCVFEKHKAGLKQNGNFLRPIEAKYSNIAAYMHDIQLGALRDHEKSIFFQAPDQIKSAAIIPINCKASSDVKTMAILTIGHSSPTHFSTGMNSTHLQILQKTLSLLLQKPENIIQLEPED